MQQWWTKLLPTTTANFVEFDVKPSKLSAAALTILYFSAACLLLLAWLRTVLPLPLIVVCLDMLWHEWLQLRLYCQSQQGRLIISISGEVCWQRQKWQVDRVKIRTRFLLLLRLRRPEQHRWLLVCRDACDEAAYRSLSLFCYSSVIYCSDDG
ncbi:hypothetical protein MD588_17395 [Photobacterium sp. SDRW27]|uniref:protein YgfX n=1 Tax=Photobacterium obscurum TaxID=2829490 RepID=UPI002244E1CF|nr:protein YgfX [Photobacterium obscurum]MCW8330582.1 hypothetical protein [Photobacterium obscurum]